MSADVIGLRSSAVAVNDESKVLVIRLLYPLPGLA
jgi:hypothetical protein